jgi:hypothetical protein
MANATRLVSNNIGNNIYQQLMVTRDQPYTFSVWLKKRLGDQPLKSPYNVVIRIQAGGAVSNQVVEVVNTRWNRYSVTITAQSNVLGVWIYENSGDVWAWGAQVENASNAGAYLKTEGTAAADEVRGIIIGGSAILSGSGAPSVAAPNGSIYLRVDGTPGYTFYSREGGKWVPK